MDQGHLGGRVVSPRLPRWLLRGALLLYTFQPSPSFSHNGAVAYATPIDLITVDGDLSDWPEQRERYAIERIEHGSAPESAKDYNAWFRVGHDLLRNRLYVAIEVVDESALIDSSSPDWDASDGCEVYLFESEPHDGRSGSRPLQYVASGKGSPGYSITADSLRSHTVVRGRSGTRHVYEWQVDLQDIQVGDVVGFDVAALDRDADGSFSYVAWGPGLGKFRSSILLGDLALVPDSMDTAFDWEGMRARLLSLKSDRLQSDGQQTDKGIEGEVSLPNGMHVKGTTRVGIHVDSTRDLHCPSVVKTATGDILLCHQDSEKHHGGDGYVRQWRSSDNGYTWRDEGPVADWRGRGLDALLGEYGRAASGRLVMMVQRREPLSDDLGIRAAWVQISDDDGHTWTEIGPVDDSHEYAAMYGRNIVTRDDTMYVGVWSRTGHSLYVSMDQGISWNRRSEIFSLEDFPGIRHADPPYYPHVVFCPDGSLLAMAYHTPPENHCCTRRSTDNGKTWGPIRSLQALRLWAPRMKVLDGRTLVATGRDIEEHATVAWFSTDNGETWGHKLIVDRPSFEAQSYAYTDLVSVGEGKHWVVTSSPRSQGKGDIIGVLLETSWDQEGR